MLPTDVKARKDIPLYSGLIKYFPDALAAVAEVSRVGNEQHNPGSELHWDRSKSTDELDSLMRHLFEVGGQDHDGQRHSAKIAWRALANLQKEIEQSQNQKSELQFTVRYLATFCGELGVVTFGPFRSHKDAQNYLDRNPDCFEGENAVGIFNSPTE